MFRLISIALIAFVLGAPVQAQHSEAPLAFALSVEDKSVEDVLLAFAATLRSMQHQGSPREVFGADALHTRVNFAFVSGAGAIADGRVKPPVADFLGEQVAQALYENSRPDSDDCYLEVFATSDGWSTVVAVHNDKQEGADLVFQCFTIGLWLQRFGLLDNMPANDWRAAYRQLLTGELQPSDQ